MFENHTASPDDENQAGPTLPVLTATTRFVRGSMRNTAVPCVCPAHTAPPAAVIPDPPPLAPGSAIRARVDADHLAPAVGHDPHGARAGYDIVELATDLDPGGDLPCDRIDAIQGAGAGRRPHGAPRVRDLARLADPGDLARDRAGRRVDANEAVACVVGDADP